MKLERLDHFGLEVGDLARAERFYTEVLGLAVVAHLGDQTLLQCGDQNLALFEVKREALSTEQRRERIVHPLGKGHHAFRVNPQDFATVRERLAGRASNARAISIGAITIACIFSTPTAICWRS